MLDRVAALLLQLSFWAEGCPCRTRWMPLEGLATHTVQSANVFRHRARPQEGFSDRRSETELSDRSWVVPQVCPEAHASCGRRRRNRRCPGRVFQRSLSPGSSPSPRFTASCCSGGSLAVTQPLWLQKTSEVSSMLEGTATARAGAYPKAMPAPVWNGIAAQLTLFSQPHMAAVIHPSGLLALRKKDFVPPLVPLLPCRSVVIAASETGVSTKTGVHDGPVLMDQCWLQWVNKLLLRLKSGKS